MNYNDVDNAMSSYNALLEERNRIFKLQRDTISDAVAFGHKHFNGKHNYIYEYLCYLTKDDKSVLIEYLAHHNQLAIDFMKTTCNSKYYTMHTAHRDLMLDCSCQAIINDKEATLKALKSINLHTTYINPNPNRTKYLSQFVNMAWNKYHHDIIKKSTTWTFAINTFYNFYQDMNSGQLQKVINNIAKCPQAIKHPDEIKEIYNRCKNKKILLSSLSAILLLS